MNNVYINFTNPPFHDKTTPQDIVNTQVLEYLRILNKNVQDLYSYVNQINTHLDYLKPELYAPIENLIKDKSTEHIKNLETNIAHMCTYAISDIEDKIKKLIKDYELE
jgi:primosomal protein N''